MMWTRQVKKALVVYDVWLKHALTMLCTLKNIIGNVIDTKQDSVRFYYLNRNIARRVEVLGKETSYDVNDVMII